MACRPINQDCSLAWQRSQLCLEQPGAATSSTSAAGAGRAVQAADCFRCDAMRRRQPSDERTAALAFPKSCCWRSSECFHRAAVFVPVLCAKPDGANSTSAE
ncbi:hypothetical protein PWT90_01575 [Aphanocladium album]|nr:hypothetical protein PWT90_01575 [Aphanocladium album]